MPVFKIALLGCKLGVNDSLKLLFKIFCRFHLLNGPEIIEFAYGVGVKCSYSKTLIKIISQLPHKTPSWFDNISKKIYIFLSLPINLFI